MKKTFTSLLFLTVLGTFSLMAQIPNTSPIPVVFSVDATNGFQGVYDYSSMADFGDTLIQTVSAPLDWVYATDSLGNQGDSLLCTPAITDMTGKIAMIRRGVCNFSLKIWHAQEAGAVGVIIVNHTYNADGGGLVGMSGGDSAALVHIPAIFVTRDDGEIIITELDGGADITATFEVRPFGAPLHAYSYHTPQSGIVPMANVGITYTNLNEADTLPNLTLTADITDPNSVTTTLTEDLTDVGPLTVNAVTFADPYLPEAVGEYNVVYSNSNDPITVERKFVITDYTYAQDNDDIVDFIFPGNQGFIDDGYRYDFGNFYRTGDQEQITTHMTFSLANPDSLFTGEPESDVFQIRLYDADPDGNGDVPGDADSYDALDESGGGAVIEGFVDYVLDGTEQPYDMLTVEFDEPVILGANKIYLLMVQYDGLNAATGISPQYAFGGDDPIAGDLGEAVYTDRFYTGGWNGDWKGVIRMHLDGFTDTEEPLDNTKISLAPNPVSDVVRLSLSLENLAPEVDVRVIDFMGRLVETYQLENVKEGTYSFDVQDLAAGTYFLSVSTPEGFRAKKFVVAR
jgi:PA domain-containing protein/type IX secretion system substrate protein